VDIGSSSFAGVRRPPAGSHDVRHLPKLLAGHHDQRDRAGLEPGSRVRRVPRHTAAVLETSAQITDVAAEVRDLRERHEQVHTWGSANLLQTLFREALVDQVNLWVCPVVLGQGKKLFPEGTVATRFEQVAPKSFQAGVLLLRYQCLEGPPETADMAEPVTAAD
jgi:riboflavin biosynthesis pyrimidine reductase